MTYQCKRSCLAASFIIKPLYFWANPSDRYERTWKKATKYLDSYFMARLMKCRTCDYITAEPEDNVRKTLHAANLNGFTKLRCPCCHAIYSLTRRMSYNGRGREIE